MGTSIAPSCSDESGSTVPFTVQIFHNIWKHIDLKMPPSKGQGFPARNPGSAHTVDPSVNQTHTLINIENSKSCCKSFA